MPKAYSRSKKRKFARNQHSGKSQSQDDTNISSSAKKLKLDPQIQSPKDGVTGYRFIDIELLFEYVNTLPCPSCTVCGQKTPSEVKNGLSSKLSFECVCGDSTFFNTSKKTAENVHEVNLRFATAITAVGRNFMQGKRFLSNMNIAKGSTAKGWTFLVQKVHAATKTVAVNSMNKAAREMLEVEPSGDIVVSCDGTWQKRGFSSKNGVCTVLRSHPDIPSKMLDIEILSNYYQACVLKKASLGEDEYTRWYATHAPQCSQNYTGSSGGMECIGMQRIFSRSQAEKGLSYTGYLGDGDSKSFTMVSAASPYGEEKVITKMECCGHIQKRMGKRLMTVVNQNKGKTFELDNGKKTKGLGGKGKLTQGAIKNLQGHYGAAIRKNSGDLEGMKNDIWATFYHRSGNHFKCGHWCPAISSNDLEKANKRKFPSFVINAIKPVYTALSKEELLTKCLHGGSQNSNESSHNLIWERCPKTTFVGRIRLELAAYDASLVFNDGESARLDIFQELGITPGVHCKAGFHLLDERRVRRAEIRATEVAKKARKEKSQANAEKQTEDEFYSTAEFHQ